MDQLVFLKKEIELFSHAGQPVKV